MSKLLNSSNFGEKLYHTLPPSYHTDDALENFSLKRYLQSLSGGGFSKVIEEINGILTLVDPDKIDAKLLPILFENYGLKIFNGIPEIYLRKLLPKISELYALKGTFTSVEYLTSIISGVKATVALDDDFKDNYDINIRLEMDYGAEGSQSIPDKSQFKRIIKEFVPFYCDMILIYVYMFYEYAKLVLEDTEQDFQVKYSSSELCSFPSRHERYIDLTNEYDKKLNNNFILNLHYVSGYDVDELISQVIKYILSENASINNIEDTQEVVYNELKEKSKEFSGVNTDEQDRLSINKSETEYLSLDSKNQLDVLSSIFLETREDSTNLKGTLAYNFSITENTQNDTFYISLDDSIDIIKQIFKYMDTMSFSLNDVFTGKDSNLKEIKTDSVTLSSKEQKDYESSLIGISLFKLNNNFKTNTYSSYDKIKRKRKSTSVFLY